MQKCEKIGIIKNEVKYKIVLKAKMIALERDDIKMGEKKIKKWEEEYNKYQNGNMNSKKKELKNKVDSKTASREEYEELKKIVKIENNVPKVKNILELRGKLQKQSDEIKSEIAKIEDLQKANKEKESIEKEFSELEKEKKEIKQKQKNPDLSEEEKKGLSEKLSKVNGKIEENNSKYVKNQKVFLDSKEVSKASKEELKKKSFVIGSKISKCNMVAGNLMKGLNWDAIEVKLDNWKDKKFTSKEKITDMAKEDNVGKTEEIKEAEGKIKDSEKDLSEKIINETEKMLEEENKEETAMTEVSEFAKKHPRLAKIGNWFKENVVSRLKKEEKQEPKEENQEPKGENQETQTDNEFKKYLKEVAEKGMDQIKKDKLQQAKEQAYKRETEKFGKEYAEKSYKNNDEGR